MINRFNNLSSESVLQLNSWFEVSTLTGQPRMNVLWRGSRTTYVTEFLTKTGYRHAYDVKTFIDYFEERKYKLENRYHTDQDFATLCDNYHKPDSVFLPVVLKKIEIEPGLSTLWGKMASNKFFKKSELYTSRLDKWLFSTDELNLDAEDLRPIMKNLLAYRHPLTKPRLENFEQFVSLRTLWGTSGSTNETVDKEFKKTKWQNALLMSDTELLDLVRKAKTPVYSIIEKSEPNTVRAVVLVDLVTYLIESYGSFYLDQLLVDHPVFYNWKSDTARYNYWLSVVNKIKLGYWFLDLDWSGWDENLKDSIYQVALDCILDVLDLYAPDFRKFEPYLRTAVKGAFLKGYKSRTTLSGLASGRRWTTLLNSVINAAFILYAAQATSIATDGNDFLVTLGDDSQTMVPSKEAAESMMEFLNSLGAKVNVSKSKITNDSPEFLKLTAYTTAVTGDQVRAVRSVLWSTEDEMHVSDDLESLQLRADLWLKLLSRIKNSPSKAFDYESVYDLMLQDLSRKSRIPKEKIFRIVNTPQALGGLGFSAAARNPLGLQIVSGKISEDHRRYPLKVPGLYSKLSSSIYSLARQTLPKTAVRKPGRWEYLRPTVWENDHVATPFGRHYVTLLTSANILTADRSRITTFVTDQLWLSQLTMKQLTNYKNEPISPTLTSSITGLLAKWSKNITFEEASGDAVSKPPIPRSAILNFGEVLSSHIWKYIWNGFFLPSIMRHLNTGKYKHTLKVAQHLLDDTQFFPHARSGAVFFGE